MLLSVPFSIGLVDSAGSNLAGKLIGSIEGLELFKLGEQIVIGKAFLAEELDSALVHSHVLCVVLHDRIPVDLRLHILEHLVAFLQSLSDVKIYCCAFDPLDCFLKLDLRAITLGNLSCDKLLLL